MSVMFPLEYTLHKLAEDLEASVPGYKNTLDKGEQTTLTTEVSSLGSSMAAEVWDPPNPPPGLGAQRKAGGPNCRLWWQEVLCILQEEIQKEAGYRKSCIQMPSRIGAHWFLVASCGSICKYSWWYSGTTLITNMNI